VEIQSIERAAAVLRLLSGRSPRRGVAELASELQLPKGTVYGIVRTLQTVGFVEQHDESGKYQLGAALLHIGSSYLDGNELRSRAIHWADALATRTGESVRIGIPHERRVLIVHQAVGANDAVQISEVGSLLPVHATALGKALLADRRGVAAELSERGLRRYTSKTVTGLDALQTQLRLVSERGWAGAVEELLPGVASIAAPIEDRGGAVVGAVAISGAIDRICRARSPRPELADYVMECARAISRELGARRE
jgi:DNA-binding IclR family transcriptional regulator